MAEMVSKRENNGSEETENDMGSEGENGGRMVMGQEDTSEEEAKKKKN